MPEHKMVTIDGIRVRAEDETRYRARTGADAPAAPLTRAQAHLPGDKGAEDGPFDPGAHDLPEVNAYLAEANEAETARVLDAEAEGKKRKTLVDRREEYLEEARKRAAAGGTGGGA
ncbi:hypothetical protein [Streptomyces griseorubiginosus]|uniref:hypothetical protein n=1 Tax=Streptomyces griseorubiginosus TaxID=67304 RepID=UPI0036EA2B0E